MARRLLALVILAAGCGRTGFGGNAGPAPTPTTRTWHSWDVRFDATGRGAVMDTAGSLQATVDCWISDGVLDPSPAFRLDTFEPAPHADNGGWAKVEAYVYSGAGIPFCGTSTVDRGDDSSESNAPPPLGVRDLTVHPPDADRDVVVAFQIPQPGDYLVEGLYARRVDDQGGNIYYGIFAPDGSVEDASVIDTPNDRAWHGETSTFTYSGLGTDDRIYFGVNRAVNWAWDSTEIAWTIRRLP